MKRIGLMVTVVALVAVAGAGAPPKIEKAVQPFELEITRVIGIHSVDIVFKGTEFWGHNT